MPPLTASLDEAIASRRWLRRLDPFPHVVARDVFRIEVYDALAARFADLLARKSGDRFTRSGGGYDAYALSFRPGTAGPFEIFASRPWHDLMASVAGVAATGDVEAGLHHHAVGSRNGTIHNDLNPGWFVDTPALGGVNLSNHRLCNYHHGPRAPGVAAHVTVRAVAMIYYLHNSPWSPGDGGETALFTSASGPLDAPAATIPPINNSLVFFECTPYSFHTFLSNRVHQRNSVIMWLHRPRADAVKRWGAKPIIPWPRRIKR